MKLAVRLQEPVARHASIRTGGPCDAWVVAHDEESVCTVLHDCKEARWRVVVVGRGTRQVFRDDGFDGLVLKLGSGFMGIHFPEPTLITVGGAVPVPAAMAAAAVKGLAPMRHLLTVPGSFGASIVYDDWDLVHAKVARPAKRESARLRTIDEVTPRTSGVVLEATVRLEAVGVDEAERRFLKTLKRCAVPPGSWVSDSRSVRSVLRRASLERVRLRQVAIPEEAPELLINLGGGTARDLQLLHRSSIERVKRVRGVQLTSVVKWVGQG